MLTTFISALSAPMGQNEAGSIPSEEDSIFATSPECLIIRVITHAQERVNACNGASTGLAHVNVFSFIHTLVPPFRQST